MRWYQSKNVSNDRFILMVLMSCWLWNWRLPHLWYNKCDINLILFEKSCTKLNFSVSFVHLFIFNNFFSDSILLATCRSKFFHNIMVFLTIKKLYHHCYSPTIFLDFLLGKWPLTYIKIFWWLLLCSITHYLLWLLSIQFNVH